MSSRVSEMGIVAQAPAARPATTARSAVAVRWYYSAASALMLALVFVGFHRFYLEGRAYPGRELAPPIRALLIAHGVSMTAWMVLFMVQPVLAAVRKMRVHRVVGSIGAVLALAITVLGWQTGIQSLALAPPEARVWGMAPAQFLIVPLGSIALFALFVGTGIWARRRPALHRPMMLLGTLAALSAAVGRIDALNTFYAGTIWDHVFGPFFSMLALGGILLTVRCLVTGSFERWFAAGYAVLVLACAAFVQIAPTELWGRIARGLLS